MKILIIQSPYYDFCSSTLIEGLIDLSKEKDIELLCSEESNYAKTSKYNFCCEDEQDLISFGEKADIIVLCSNNGVKEYLIERIRASILKTVYLDGEDTSPYKKDPVNFVLYFKREMLKSIIHPGNVISFPFAAENRYFNKSKNKSFDELWFSKNIDFSCMFGPHDEMKPWRKRIEEKLLELQLEKYFNSQIGQVYGGKFYIDIDTGNRDHEHYYTTLLRSKISFDAYGAHGCQAARFYEILANGCCLATQQSRIYMPDNKEFVDGYDSIVYSENDIEEKLDFCLNDEVKLYNIAKNGFEFVNEYHTSKARAKFFLKQCKSVNLI